MLTKTGFDLIIRRNKLTLIRGGGNNDPRLEFERLYRESYPLVYNYVCRRMANRDAAEDVVADAFLRAARFFERFDSRRAKFSTWVISIARNCINDYYEQNPLSEDLEIIPEGFYAKEDDQVALIGDQDLVIKLMRVLDDEERELVYLKYYQEMRNVEIAEALGINASTISTKLSRAMVKMRAIAQ